MELELKEVVRKMCPRIGELWDQLPAELRGMTEIAVPVTGERPYFGVAQDSAVLQPANPELKAIYVEMSSLLWEYAEAACRELMLDAQQRWNYVKGDEILGGYYDPTSPFSVDGEGSRGSQTEWIDGTATVLEVRPGEPHPQGRTANVLGVTAPPPLGRRSDHEYTS